MEWLFLVSSVEIQIVCTKQTCLSDKVSFVNLKFSRFILRDPDMKNCRTACSG